MSFLIHRLLDDQAHRDPDRAASAYLDQSLTYGELARRSNQLAHMLIDRGVRRHDRVGIYMDKSIDTPVALYGIMKAGAAYVPLDPSAPAARVAAVASDCGIRHIVSAPSKLRRLRALAAAPSPIECVVGVDAGEHLDWRGASWADVAAMPDAGPPALRVIESDLAYLIYTSGSTGTPKGIMHTHHSGLSFARWAAPEYGLVAADRLSNHAPLHFDLSIFDYFAALVAGASTVIIPEEHTKLPASYTQLLQDHRVTVLFTVPFALIQMSLRGALDERDLSALRWAIFGGEPFPPVYLRELMRQLPHVRFDNMYGPAEVNGCTHYTVTEIGDEAIPIGPVADCAEALIVDAAGAAVPCGETGELLVRTPTMMRGYWQRDDLNAKAFYTRRNAAGQPETFFRTGDLVAELDDGALRFVGRKDRQVKVRGYRVELDEIELALTADASVEEAAVFTLADETGSQQLHARVTLRDGAGATPAEITRSLRARLPWYAVPADIRVLPVFPRTQTGKIDRRRLSQQAEADPAQHARGGERQHQSAGTESTI